MSFFVLRTIAQSDNSISSWTGYTVGGEVGTNLGILISKYLHW
jgi:hypothetical protein